MMRESKPPRKGEGGTGQSWEKYNSQANNAQQQKAFKKPRSSASNTIPAATALLSPPTDHDDLMRRPSYQNIFNHLSDSVQGSGAQNSNLNPNGKRGHQAAEVLSNVLPTNAHQATQKSNINVVTSNTNAASSNINVIKPSQAIIPGTNNGMVDSMQQGMMPRQQQHMPMQMNNKGVPMQAVTMQYGQIPFQQMNTQMIGHPVPLSSSPLQSTTSRSSPMSDDGMGGCEVGKRESRLHKNRLAAKECRRKKKEYVKDLEDKCKQLEQRNELLIQQLEAARASLTNDQKKQVASHMAPNQSAAPDRTYNASKKKT
eukprot:m.31757 g.31757  ORF g.31757 m.31757 type:complete len:314 (-) comp16510_c0_seq1:255-1196(-)